MKGQKIKFAIIVALQVAALFGMIGYKQYPLVAGKRVWLKVVPVDPRSLMSGDYVNLSYEISRLTNYSNIKDSRPGTTLFTKVKRGPEGYYTPAGVYGDRPAVGADEAVIRGSINPGMGITYGIESFYVEVGTGHDIERFVRSGNVYALVAVTSGGRASLVKLAANGVIFE